MKMFGRSKVKGESKKERRERETTELRSQIRPKLKPKKDPIEAVKQRQKEFTARMHQDYKPQEYGLKLWWVLGFDKTGKKHYDMFYSAWEADRKCVTWDDGEVFMLRNIDTKRKAEKEIDRILEERQEEEVEVLRGRLSSIETPKRTPTEPSKHHIFGFGRNGKNPEE